MTPALRCISLHSRWSFAISAYGMSQNGGYSGQHDRTASASNPEEDDSVLRDVLEELDRERSQRAELEAKVRVLLQGDSKKNHKASSKDIVSRKDWIALKTEKDGLVELLDALLSETPAFQAAKKTTSLPMHALRLLEIMPWDSRARQHAIGKEELYEWQVFQKQKNQWVQHIRQFPPLFRNLPVVQPNPGQETDVKRKGIFGDIIYPPKHVVLTDAKLSYVVNIDKGYPLPDDGTTWEWVAGWRVDRHVQVLEKERSMDCDDQGWSYALNPTDFGVRELCWDGATDDNGDVIRPYRRRSWTRRRVLVSYPNASQPTLEYLQLLGENMRLAVSVTKLSDQLVTTKTALTEKEAELLETKEEKKVDAERFKKRIEKAEELLNELGICVESEGDKKEDASLLLKVDSLRKEQAEKIQNVWRSSSWNGSNSKEDDINVSGKAMESDQRFDWKRISRGGFMSPSLLPGRRTPRDDTIILLEEPEEQHAKQGEENTREGKRQG